MTIDKNNHSSVALPDYINELEDENSENYLIKEDALSIIDKRNSLFDRLLATALHSTKSSDWIDQNGKPYLQVSACEKVARRFGVRIFDLKSEREDLEDEKGSYYIYTISGKAALGDRDEIEAIGTGSSRDKFFGSQRGELKAKADIDITNIKKKAYTNFLGNAITRLLGIRNLTWDDLAAYGLYKNQSQSVSYKKTSKSKASPSKPYWTNNYMGQVYLWAEANEVLSEDFLENSLFMRPSKKAGKYFCLHDPQKEEQLKAYLNSQVLEEEIDV